MDIDIGVRVRARNRVRVNFRVRVRVRVKFIGNSSRGVGIYRGCNVEPSPSGIPYRNLLRLVT